jgi:hypothetical protein
MLPRLMQVHWRPLLPAACAFTPPAAELSFSPGCLGLTHKPRVLHLCAATLCCSASLTHVHHLLLTPRPSCCHVLLLLLLLLLLFFQLPDCRHILLLLLLRCCYLQLS